MDIFYKTLPKRHKTNNQGVYFKEIEKITVDDNGKTKVNISLVARSMNMNRKTIAH